MTVQELRALLEKLQADQTALLARVKQRWEKIEDKKGEQRLTFVFAQNATTEEQEEWDKRDAEFEQRKGELKAITEQGELEARHQERADWLKASAGAIGSSIGVDPGTVERDAAKSAEEIEREEERAIRRYLIGGIANLTPEQRKAHALRRLRAEAADLAEDPALMGAIIEKRAQSYGTGSEGGFLAAEGFSGRYEKKLVAFGGMLTSGAEIINTPNGNTIRWPTVDDTGNTGTLQAENTEVAETDVVFGQKQLDSYLVTSDLIFASVQSLQNADIPLDSIITDLGAERVARKSETLFTTGTGTSQHQGIVPASTQGKLAASASAFTYLEMIDLKFSVDHAYWSNPENARWGMNVTSVYKAVKQLLDADNRPIFQPDVRSGTVDRADGHRINLLTGMASIAASAKIMLFGDFYRFKVRRVAGPIIMRLTERKAEFLQVGFMFYEQSDSELMETTAVKHMVLAA